MVGGGVRLPRTHVKNIEGSRKSVRTQAVHTQKAIEAIPGILNTHLEWPPLFKVLATQGGMSLLLLWLGDLLHCCGCVASS